MVYFLSPFGDAVRTQTPINSHKGFRKKPSSSFDLMSRTKTHTVRRHCPLLPTTIPRSLNMWATSRWLNQANSAVQDGRGRKRMEEGRNEPRLLSWYELCPRDSLKQWLLTAHVEILPQTVLTWCVREREESRGEY